MQWAGLYYGSAHSLWFNPLRDIALELGLSVSLLRDGPGRLDEGTAHNPIKYGMNRSSVNNDHSDEVYCEGLSSQSNSFSFVEGVE